MLDYDWCVVEVFEFVFVAGEFVEMSLGRKHLALVKRGGNL